MIKIPPKANNTPRAHRNQKSDMETWLWRHGRAGWPQFGVLLFLRNILINTSPNYICWLMCFQRSQNITLFLFFFFHVKSRSNRLGMCRQKDRVNVCMYAKLLHLCLSLCDPMDCSPPGSSVQGSLQARILQWVAIPSSRGSSWPRDQAYISYDFCTGRRVLYH